MNHRKLAYRTEREGDRDGIRRVHREAFPTGDESRLVDELRAGGFVRSSRVAADRSGILGHILFSDVRIEGAPEGFLAVALAPLAVLPRVQRQGIGSRLVSAGLREVAGGESCHAVIVLGHEHFYPRFGFSAELARPLLSPFSGPHWMALELVRGALKGIRGRVKYPPPFGIPD